MEKRVLIASPVKQKPMILSEFLESLQNLDTSGVTADFIFIDDQNDHDLLDRFAASRPNVKIYKENSPALYVCDETTHHWREDLIWKVAAFKDKFIQQALDGNYDYLFLLDSDLYVKPQTLLHLISLSKEVVSEVFWTQWEPDLIPLPQVWVSDQYRLYEIGRGENLDEAETQKRTRDFLQLLAIPGTYKVGGLGACTLISKKALEIGVSFRPIYNLGFIGEDRHFCIRAAALGLELFADTHYPPFHIYRESELVRLPEFKQQLYGSQAGQQSILQDILQSIPQPDVHSIPQTCLQTDQLTDPQITPTENQEKTSLIESSRKSLDHSPKTSDPSVLDQGNDKKSALRKFEITLAMLVRNEANRYLERVLSHAAQYIDKAVILDDASEDNTVDVCKRILTAHKIPFTLVLNSTTGFNNEVVLRKQLWEVTVSNKPDWILILDADEMFEDEAVNSFKALTDSYPEVDYYAFRLYDMWTEDSYREDKYWSAHKWYRPFMVKYIPGFQAEWLETPQHCGRFPKNITDLKGEASFLRVKHLGWLKPADRLQKYYRYKELDPKGAYGIIEQYQSILDPRPNLIIWE